VARARVVTSVCQSAQPPADRSVQRLIPRRRRTAPAHRWAARPRFGPTGGDKRAQWTLHLRPHLRPPGGAQRRHRRRCALPVPLRPVTPVPLVRGFCQSLRSCRYRGFATLPGPWRRFGAALGVLPRGSPRATESGATRPASVPLRSSLPPCKASQYTAGGLSGVKATALRCAPGGAPPQP
jgi:hypothetical protein